MATLLWTASAFAFALASAAPAEARPVNSADAACTVAKTRVAARDNFPVSRVGFCDIIPAAHSPSGYYVLALHSRRRCDYICSTNMGWFAVEKSSGRVFEWDVGEWLLGPEIRRRP